MPSKLFPWYKNRSLLLLGAILVLSSCNPIFVMQAAYEHSKILVARRPLQEVIEDPKTIPEDRLKLQLVGKAREFSAWIGLEPGDTFTAYTELDRDPVAWVVSASRKDAFIPYTWWFPIVGTMPYRGYFNKEDAISSSRELEKKGAETWVRGTAAFSTLGWFNDPLLSSTLKLTTLDVIATVIHETVHATIWIPGSVAFNESLANYVGTRAAIDYFEWLEGQSDSPLSDDQRIQLRDLAQKEFEKELDISDFSESLYQSLEQLYASELSSEQKIEQRDKVLENERLALYLKHPDITLPAHVNNAEIMQRKLYLSNLRHFDKLFVRLNGNWKDFMLEVEKIAEQVKDKGGNSFKLLERR